MDVFDVTLCRFPCLSPERNLSRRHRRRHPQQRPHRLAAPYPELRFSPQDWPGPSLTTGHQAEAVS
jgi:hypothetical protein